MRVKICGITRLEDALCAIKYGCDALGFIFYKKSARYIEPQKVKEIIDSLPPFIEKVGVFVNESGEEIDEIMRLCGLSLAQVYPENLNGAMPTYPYIEVVRIKSKEQLDSLPKDRYLLIDAFVEQYGGEGQRVALEWFSGVDCSRFILAGGIDSSNVTELEDYGFYGVDISSGVEASRGIKDCKKIEEFIKIVKDIV